MERKSLSPGPGRGIQREDAARRIGRTIGLRGPPQFTRMEAEAPSRAPDLEVLVVDDDPDARSALIALVETFGIVARGAEDGEAALRLVTGRRPDLILCDLRMPGLDGYGFVRRLRRNPRFRNLLTIAMSGRPEAVDTTATRKAGFDGHVLVPLAAEGLARLLDRALDVREQREDQSQRA